MSATLEERTAIALGALAEVTEPGDVGDLLEAEEVEPGVIDLRFACALPGYPGWKWTVSTSDIVDAAPTVLEVELLPSDGALLAPPWVPWTERLAEWRRQHPDGDPAAEGLAELDDDEDDTDDDTDEDDTDEDVVDDDLDDDDLDDVDDDDVVDEVDVDLLDGVEVDEADDPSEAGDDHDEGPYSRD